MGQNKAKEKHTKKFTAMGIVFAILGLLLFAYFVGKAGVSEISSGIRRLGVGFLLIFMLGGLRQAAHAVAWINCFEPPYRLRFIDAFKARLMGDALGNMLPLGGLVVSEPSKAMFVRDRVPLMAGVSALAIENIFYALSVALFISSGALALLLSFPLQKRLWYVSISALIAVVVTVPLGFLVIRKQWKFLSGALAFVGNRGIGRKRIGAAVPRARILEDRIYGFYQRNRSRFLFILIVEMCFHVAGVAEGYLTLSFVSNTIAPTLLTAFILESVNRVITLAFKFIPFRMGVDEAGTGKLSEVLGFTPATGVTLAIVRKARDVCWTAIGVALMVRRGISVRAAARESEEVVEEISSTEDALATAVAGESR
jgi:hypothetical protein